MVSTPMDPEIQKLVEEGKLAETAAQALMRLRPGTYCLHRSWGFGQIDSWDPFANELFVRFRTRPRHAMRLEYAAESLEPLGADHILVLRTTRPEEVRRLAAQDPVALVRLVLGSYGGSATASEIAESLSDGLLPEGGFNAWWNSTKKALRNDGHFSVPARKAEPVTLREAALSRAQELIAQFRAARTARRRVAALENIVREADAFEPGAPGLQEAVEGIEDFARKNRRLHPEYALTALLARDLLCERIQGLRARQGDLSVRRWLAEEGAGLARILRDLPVEFQCRAIAELPAAHGEHWVERTLDLLPEAGARMLSEIERLFAGAGLTERLGAALQHAIAEGTISAGALYWLCRERRRIPFRQLLDDRLFRCILIVLERERLNENRSRRLHDQMVNDRELVTDLLGNAELETMREIARLVWRNDALEEVGRRAILARLITLQPEVRSTIAGEETATTGKSMVVSWESLERRRAELEDLVGRQIPANSRDIAVARSYGDLRENAEFKAAKEMQAVLLRRRAELEHELAIAQGTAFENTDTSRVSIGTRVRLREVDTGEIDEYAILGAWDGDAARGYLSYLTALGQALLDRAPGDVVSLPLEKGERRCEIVAIEAWKPTAAP